MRVAPPNTVPLGKSVRGFSLMELLVSITVIGLVCSFTVMAMGSARSGAEDTKDRRNAQEIAGVASAAAAAGADYIVEGDEKATIKNLVAGCSPAQGVFKGRLFKAPDLGEPEVKGAMRFLALQGSILQYRMDGTASP